jgi:hypothetical protein
MLKSFWTISTDYEIVDTFKGTLINISNSEQNEIIVLDGLPLKYNKNGIRTATQKVGFKVNKERSKIKMLELAHDLGIIDQDKNLLDLEHMLSILTAGQLKSLLQKLIRYRSKLVDNKIPTKVVLFITMFLLIKNVGSLVPDIQIFVSGLTSFCKRLAIIACEDSFIINEKILLSLFVGGILSQRVKSWFPDYEMIKIWFQFGFDILESEKCHIYNIEKGLELKPYVISNKNTDLQNCSAILDDLKSFKGDIGLVRYLASQIKYKTISKDSNYQDRIMPLYHFIDQHCCPNFAYFYNYRILPFGKTFDLVFKNITGINPRKKDIDLKDPFVTETKNAQRLFGKWMFKEKEEEKEEEKKNEEKEKNETYPLDHILSDDFIPGLIGTLEIKGALATLKRNDDSFSIVAIKKPSRDSEDSTLSDDRYEKVIEIVKEKLQEGIKIKISPFKGQIIKFSNVETLEIKNITINNIKWKKIKQLHFDIPYLSNINLTLNNAIINTSNGIMIDAFTQLDQLLKLEDLLIIKRLVMYLSTKQEYIEMNKISRDGAGINHSVSVLDVEVFQLLLKISMLFSFALKPSSICQFKITNSFLLWNIKDHIIKNYITVNFNKLKYNIKKSSSFNQRKHWEHQTISINGLIKEHNSGQKGHFIWIPVGMGKTDIVFSFLLYLNERKELPLNTIYTLPQSAMKSIINEAINFGFNVRIIVPIKEKQKPIDGVEIIQSCSFKPNTDINQYTITLIEHDHLRLCESELIKISSQSIFIIDEVHKALNDTKRTTTALEMSRLSLEFIALTGTPVIDSKIYKLMWWLEQIVPFQLNNDNFFVAINNMISQKVNTGIKVVRIEVPVIMEGKILEKYQKLVPGTLGGSNKNPSHDDLKKATDICYKLCFQKMVELTNEKIEEEKKHIMVVSKNSDNQQYFKEHINGNIFIIEKKDSIFLTDENVESGKVEDYDAIITTIKKSEGYTLTRCDTLISSIYPSNNATREQLEGRINRLGSNFKTVFYYYVHTGILTYILHNHNNAKSLSVALKAIVANKK